MNDIETVTGTAGDIFAQKIDISFKTSVSMDVEDRVIIKLTADVPSSLLTSGSSILVQWLEFKKKDDFTGMSSAISCESAYTTGATTGDVANFYGPDGFFVDDSSEVID